MLGIFDHSNGIIVQTYLPIEEDLPTPRKVLLVNDSDATLVFTTNELASEFADVHPSATIIRIEDVEHRARLISQPAMPPDVLYNPDLASYREFS